MVTIFVYGLGAVVALCGIMSAVISNRPSAFRIQRSALISAPPGVVYALISDMHHWSEWSPWEKLDPQMKKTFSGAESGPGAVYEWSGNNKAGEGRMTIVDGKAGEFINMKLEFIKPFKCTNQVMFKMEPTGAGTTVSWIMDGQNNFMAKAFHMMMNMDKMVGKDFEEGLSNLDKLVQKKV